MNIMVNFSLNPNTKLTSVAIKVKDFDRMLSFYQQVVGFDLINEENDMAILGIRSQKRKLLGLISTPDGVEGSNTQTGLNHTSFVFPTRDDLARFIKHLMLLNYPIEGESDHGYCESVYISDPENNRLEFSWDKPKDEWPMNDGKIDGVTKELNIQKCLNRVEGEYTSVPEETKVGHVHLSVSDLEEVYKFYAEKLGFKIKDDDFSLTHLLSVNDYHHQLAINEAQSNGASPVIRETDLGVDHVTFDVPTMDDLFALKENLEQLGCDFYFNKGKRIIGLYDPSGIHLWFIVFKKQPK